ncbi:MAG: nucleotide exchange factor GrpE [Burkholderiales bacterium]|nr:nucleotide exchange factor GrpE [Burkholderiales bacterium]
MTSEIDPTTLADDVAATIELPQGDSALDKAIAEAAEYKDAFLRARAEAENTRRIAQADVAKAHKYAVESFALDLLPVKDALEMALAAGEQSVESIRTGVELTLKELRSAFARAKLAEVDPAPGEKFDPHRHEAMAMAPSPQPAGTVVTVYEKGYLVNDRVLRPAKVVVSSGLEGG